MSLVSGLAKNLDGAQKVGAPEESSSSGSNHYCSNVHISLGSWTRKNFFLCTAMNWFLLLLLFVFKEKQGKIEAGSG